MASHHAPVARELLDPAHADTGAARVAFAARAARARRSGSARAPGGRAVGFHARRLVSAALAARRSPRLRPGPGVGAVAVGPALLPAVGADAKPARAGHGPR